MGDCVNCESCADCWTRTKSCLKKCWQRTIEWFWYHKFAVIVFIIGWLGVALSMILIPDQEWKITSLSYFSAIGFCSLVPCVCRRGNLYYKNIEEVSKHSKPSAKSTVSIPDFNKLKDNEVLALISSQSSSFVLSDNPTSNERTLREDFFESIKEPPAGFQDPKVASNLEEHPDDQQNVTVAEVHQHVKESEQSSPKPGSPDDNESSSNAVPSDLQDSTATPQDSGIVESAEIRDYHQTPPPEPKIF